MSFIWDNESKSIRGSFVNLIITFSILGLICYGSFNKSIADNIQQLSGLIIGFFTVSFGVWKVSNVITDLNKE